jgi:hypothetical protein
MWILKNSKELLENSKSHDFCKIDSIKTYDFFTLYTTIPHNKLKSKQKGQPEIQISTDWETRHIFRETPF